MPRFSSEQVRKRFASFLPIRRTRGKRFYAMVGEQPTDAGVLHDTQSVLVAKVKKEGSLNRQLYISHCFAPAKHLKPAGEPAVQ